jgi:alpha-glucoside transport system permease protein
VYLGTDSRVATMPARLNELVGSKGEAWHVLTAGAFLTMIVPLAVFLGLQRYFVRGLLTGSVKA